MILERVFVRGVCQHCGGHIEFPQDYVGDHFTCPHCRKLTELSAPPAPGATHRTEPGLSLAFVLLVTGIILAVIAGFVGYALLQNHKARVAEQERAALAAIEATRTKEIRGQVYLALRGGDSVKFGAVEVLVVSASEATHRFAERFAMLRTNLQQLVAERNSRGGSDPDEQIRRLNNPSTILRGTWKSVAASAMTDADGRFKMQVPARESWWITAYATRLEGAYSVAQYGWLVPLEPDSNGEMFLNNKNCLPLPLDLNTLQINGQF